MSAEACIKCGAAPRSIADASWDWQLYAGSEGGGNFRCWECGSVSSTPDKFRQSAKCRIRELETELERLKEEAKLPQFGLCPRCGECVQTDVTCTDSPADGAENQTPES